MGRLLRLLHPHLTSSLVLMSIFLASQSNLALAWLWQKAFRSGSLAQQLAAPAGIICLTLTDGIRRTTGAGELSPPGPTQHVHRGTPAIANQDIDIRSVVHTMGIDITISTRQGACYAGDVIEGAVHLNVSAQNEEGSSADELVLRLYGVAKTRVMYDTTNMAHNNSNAQSYTHREMLTEKKEFLSYDVQLAAFGGKAASGSHSFPFQVMLPPGLPPSMEENGSQGGSCEIFYGFEARLHRPGMLHFDAKGKAKLTVLSKPHEATAATPVLVGPATQTVKKFCCFKSGSMSIGFQADHSEVGLNETVGLTVVARNDSSAEVKTMHVEIKQVSTWFARGYKESKTRTVAAIVVPGTQLRASEKGNQRGRSSAVIADTARADLQEQLGAGAGTRYDLLVPGNSLLTLKADLIEVKHTLSVMLKTPHCISSPDVWTPLLVHAGTTSAPDGVSGEGSFVPHSGEAIPFATGLDDEGNVKPVSVPQSAVTMKYTNNISKF